MHKWNKPKNHCETALQTFISFDNIQRKSLQDKSFDWKRKRNLM